MSQDHRKHRRVELDYVAQLLGPTGDLICDCAVIDVSEGGARVAVLAADMVPDEFVLRLSASCNVGRRCKVVWRRDDEVGVIFFKAVDAAKAKLAARIARLTQSPCP